ncbi:ATP-binding protein [Streptomyces sp. NPDC017941]|uniref:ATP-binding protein n=1 Tax=unclassified Streptomyces TaxID=2593676 RepID=UPI0037BD48D5
MNEETSPTPPAPPAPLFSRFYPRVRRSVPDARAFAGMALAIWGVQGEAADAVVLCVSELTTNALLHGVPPGRGYLLRIGKAGTAVRVEVHDSGDGRPRLAKGGVGESGRGLLLVSALADKWGVEPRDPGKVVWAEFTHVSGATPPPTGWPDRR